MVVNIVLALYLLGEASYANTALDPGDSSNRIDSIAVNILNESDCLLESDMEAHIDTGFLVLHELINLFIIL